MAKTAILIDGGFYRKMAAQFYGQKSGKDRAEELIDYCYKHVKNKDGTFRDELYRIFYYDCPPLSKKMTNPITGEQTDYSKSPMWSWYKEFIGTMVRQRKVALRNGRLSDETAGFIINSNRLKELIQNKTDFKDLSPDDLTLDVRQKGVDMKIGVDIASLAYKKQVDRIILIAGDSDFVPASKLARREGIDFVLDSMHHHINPDLYEHIDGLITKAQSPRKNKK